MKIRNPISPTRVSFRTSLWLFRVTRATLSLDLLGVFSTARRPLFGRRSLLRGNPLHNLRDSVIRQRNYLTISRSLPVPSSLMFPFLSRYVRWNQCDARISSSSFCLVWAGTRSPHPCFSHGSFANRSIRAPRSCLFLTIFSFGENDACPCR